jgi:hypothetical protein
MTLFAYSGAEADGFAKAFARNDRQKESRILKLFSDEEKIDSPRSSNQSSIAKEMFDNIMSDSFEEEDTRRSSDPRLDSTLDSSLIASQNPKFETFESLFASLDNEETQILQNLNFLCFDQVGCRMLQERISKDDDEKFKIQNGAFYKCLMKQILPLLTEVIVNQFGNYLCQKIIEGADPIILSAIINSIND